MHTRIRKFNTRDTYPEQKLDNDLCQAVVAHGRTVFVRGQVGQDLDTAVNVVRNFTAKDSTSGNVTLATVRAIAESGVDYISSGAITHSAPNLDLALDF